MERMDRRDAQPRPLTLIPDFVETADGSCPGRYRGQDPRHLHRQRGGGHAAVPARRGRGWVTVSTPCCPHPRGGARRDGIKRDGRSVEIQRLIGRSLRQAVDMGLLGERTITLDCDVLQADGGTRTASITGAYVALVMAVHKLMQNGLIDKNPIIAQVAAISAGVVDGRPHAGPVLSGGQPRPDRYEPGDEPAGRVHRVRRGTGEGRPFSNRELAGFWTGPRGVRAMMHAQRDAARLRANGCCPAPGSGGQRQRAQAQGAADIFGGMVELVGMKDAGFEGDIEENGTTLRRTPSSRPRPSPAPRACPLWRTTAA